MGTQLSKYRIKPCKMSHVGRFFLQMVLKEKKKTVFTYNFIQSYTLQYIKLPFKLGISFYLILSICLKNRYIKIVYVKNECHILLNKNSKYTPIGVY